MHESKVIEYQDEKVKVQAAINRYEGFITGCINSGKTIHIGRTKDIVKVIISAKLIGLSEKATHLRKLARGEVQVKSVIMAEFRIYDTTYDEYNGESRKCSIDELVRQFKEHDEKCAIADKRISMFVKAMEGLA